GAWGGGGERGEGKGEDGVGGRAASHAAPTPPVPPAPPAEAVARAKACEEQLAGVAKGGLIHFHYASAELESASFPTLDQLAPAAKSCPGMHIQVPRHANAQGSPQSNPPRAL